MKTMTFIDIDQDINEIYTITEELFGTMRADAEYFNLTHPQY